MYRRGNFGPPLASGRGACSAQTVALIVTKPLFQDNQLCFLTEFLDVTLWMYAVRMVQRSYFKALIDVKPDVTHGPHRIPTRLKKKSVLNDRHLCSSVLCFREDNCGSHAVHQGRSEDTYHHWSPAISAAASPSRRLARGHVTQVGHDCRQWLCHHLPFILSYIMLHVSSVGNLCK